MAAANERRGIFFERRSEGVGGVPLSVGEGGKHGRLQCEHCNDCGAELPHCGGGENGVAFGFCLDYTQNRCYQLVKGVDSHCQQKIKGIGVAPVVGGLFPAAAVKDVSVDFLSAVKTSPSSFDVPLLI